LDIPKFETSKALWDFTSRMLEAALTDSDLILVISNIEALVYLGTEFKSFMKDLIGVDFDDGSNHQFKIILTCSREDGREGLPAVFDDPIFGEWFNDGERPQEFADPDAPPRNAV
jgi:hypothetical protein